MSHQIVIYMCLSEYSCNLVKLTLEQFHFLRALDHKSGVILYTESIKTSAALAAFLLYPALLHSFAQSFALSDRTIFISQSSPTPFENIRHPSHPPQMLFFCETFLDGSTFFLISSPQTGCYRPTLFEYL